MGKAAGEHRASFLLSPHTIFFPVIPRPTRFPVLPTILFSPTVLCVYPQFSVLFHNLPHSLTVFRRTILRSPAVLFSRILHCLPERSVLAHGALLFPPVPCLSQDSLFSSVTVSHAQVPGASVRGMAANLHSLSGTVNVAVGAPRGVALDGEVSVQRLGTRMS